MAWIEQGNNPIEKPTSYEVEEDSLESHLLTAPDIARKLNISIGNAYRLIQLGEIPSVRNKRNVRVRREDLDEFITNNRK